MAGSIPRMHTPATCIQWARLVQVAEAHDIQWTFCADSMTEPYKIDHDKRVIHIKGELDIGTDGYMAMAAALTELVHDNVHMLYRPPLPDTLRQSGSPG